VSSDDWAAQGVFEVAAGVYRIPLPLGDDALRAVNVYALTATDSLTLIDSGWAIPGAEDCLSARLRDLGFTLGDVTRFLVTHVHRDHYSQAIQLRRKFGTPVSLGVEERWSLEAVMQPGRDPDDERVVLLRRLGAFDLADRIEANPIPADTTEWELPTQWLANHDVVEVGGRSIEVIETPGHTRGHVVFLDRAASLLFAGDHVLPTITPSIGFEPARTANPLGAYLRSLAIVRSEGDTKLLPAHGPVTDSTHQRIDALTEHHRVRLSAMLTAVGEGARTAFEVASAIQWTRRNRELAALNDFNQFLAIAETGAHLDLLVAQDGLTCSSQDGASGYALS
jgi:glyoxylase-like metal-dependent hydrolase (beta-lactamase superfamily II)